MHIFLQVKKCAFIIFVQRSLTPSRLPLLSSLTISSFFFFFFFF
ncbi:unnamed protein product, partial [Staurois parvus]